MKKGFTQHWIEIIGGVIIVVLILLAVILFGSTISTAVEDAQAVSMFGSFKSAMRESSEGFKGIASISDFRLETSVKGRYYAITYIPLELTHCWLGKGDVCGAEYELYERGENHLEKCYQPGQHHNDACMCVIRVDLPHRDKYSLFEHNLYKENWGGTPLQDAQSIQGNWGEYLMVEEIQYLKHPNVKILGCAMVMDEIGCSYFNETLNYAVPCMLREDGRNVYWVMGGRHKGYIGTSMPFEQEVITFKSNTNRAHRIDMELTS